MTVGVVMPRPARVRIAELCVAVALLGWPLVFGQSRFALHIGVMVALYATLAMSMNLMLRLGQLSLAHGALFGIGAYASAILTRDAGMSFVPAFGLAGLASAFVALLMAPLFMRVKGVHFALLTFAFGEVVVLCFVEFVGVFGGNSGFGQIPPAAWFGHAASRYGSYLIATSLALAVYVALQALYRRELGMIVDASRHDEALVVASGFEPLRFRIGVFGLSAALAGWSGSLFAHYQGYISPDSFGFWIAVNAVVINVLGGVGALVGVVFGAVLLIPLPELLRGFQQYQRLVYGVVLMMLLCFMPQGLAGLVAAVRQRRVRGTRS